MRTALVRSLLLSLTLPAFALGCAKTETKADPKTAADAKKEETKEGPGADPTPPPPVDKSRCDAAGKKIIDTDLNRDGKADVRKYLASVVENGAKVDVLVCREADLNQDGKRDVWTYYDNNGNITLEEMDLDFDGKIDMVAYRQQGKIVREEYDSNFDGKVDMWKFYEGGRVVRIERSSKRNGKVDVWEYYEGGRLDRIGYDTTGSGQVSRWERAPEEPGEGAGGSNKAPAPPTETVPQPAGTPAAKPAATTPAPTPAKEK